MTKSLTLFEAIIKEWDDKDVSTKVYTSSMDGGINVNINVRQINIEGKSESAPVELYYKLMEIWISGAQSYNPDISRKDAIKDMPSHISDYMENAFKSHDDKKANEQIQEELDKIGDMYLQLVKGVCMKYMNKRNQIAMSDYEKYEGLINDEIAKLQKNSSCHGFTGDKSVRFLPNVFVGKDCKGIYIDEDGITYWKGRRIYKIRSTDYRYVEGWLC